INLSNHNQEFRILSTTSNCIDTSNVATINISDTCITNVTVYDTLLTTVTDTLVINSVITGINPPNNLNTLKVYPNPASTHITIDYGNFNAMSGYTLTIVNSIGQTVFTTAINQQTSYIDLSTWSGNGIYFVQLIDPQNNTIENRKIVIQ
ncbi:MAG: T9SS type A sorting domain-containing protein, partial [Bacteroidota bacterium]